MKISSIPATLAWKNPPEKSASDGGGELRITAGGETDWFIDPTGDSVKANAPIALFAPPEMAFRLQAKVTVDFTSTYDAGSLFLFAQDALWAKLCFEYSPQQRPTIVSVVTRGVSDDCNSAEITDRSVYLRLYRHHEAWAFHYSLEARLWHLVRYFSLGELEQVRVGFSSQSPLGSGCLAAFSEIRYISGMLAGLRNGE